MPLDVDELIEGYDEYHRKTMSLMHTRFSCGRTLRIKDATAGAVIVGRRVWQDSDGSFSYTIHEFTAARLPPTEVPGGNLTSTKTVDEQMLMRVQGLLGGFHLLLGTGRPDVAAAAWTVPAGYQLMSLELVRDGKSVVKRAKNETISCKIHQFEDDRVIVAFTGLLSSSAHIWCRRCTSLAR